MRWRNDGSRSVPYCHHAKEERHLFPPLAKLRDTYAIPPDTIE